MAPPLLFTHLERAILFEFKGVKLVKTQRQSILSFALIVTAATFFLATEFGGPIGRGLASTSGGRRMTNAELRRSTEALKASSLSLADFQMQIDSISPERYMNWAALADDISDIHSKINRSALDSSDRTQLLEELEQKRRTMQKLFPHSAEGVL